MWNIVLLQFRTYTRTLQLSTEILANKRSLKDLKTRLTLMTFRISKKELNLSIDRTPLETISLLNFVKLYQTKGCKLLRS